MTIHFFPTNLVHPINFRTDWRCFLETSRHQQGELLSLFFGAEVSPKNPRKTTNEPFMRNEFPTKKLTSPKKILGNFEMETWGNVQSNFEVFTKLPSENKKILKFQVCWFETLGGFQVTPLFIAPYDGSRESKPSLPFKLLSAMKALVFGFSTFNTGRLQR